MQTRRLVLPLLAGAVALSLTAAPARAAKDSGDLYLQQASGGKLSGSKLVLTGVARRMSAFTDRPQRRASSVTTSSFVSRFGQTFRGDPPNAALQIEGRSARNDVALLELRRPRYDNRKRTLTYTVKRLTRTTGGLRRLGQRADRGVTGRFGRSALFIDSGGAGDFFGIALSAPQGQTTSITLTGNASFDMEATQSTVAPLTPNATPLVTIADQTMSVKAVSGTGNATAVVLTWVNVAGQNLTGTASIPAGGGAEITLGGNASLSNGPFSVPF